MAKRIYIQKNSKNNPKIPEERYSVIKNFMIYFRTLKKCLPQKDECPCEGMRRQHSESGETDKFTGVK